MTTGKKLAIIGAGIGGLALTAFLALYIPQKLEMDRQSKELATTIAESKELGLPMVSADLKRSVADSDNAALILIPLFGKQFPSAHNQGRPFTRYAQEGANEKALNVLATNKASIDKVVEATAKSDWYRDREYDRSIVVLFPEYASMKSATKLLTQRAVVSAQQGDDAAALKDLKAARKLGQYLVKDPTLLGLLVAIAIDAIVLRCAENLATEFAGDGTKLANLQSVLDSTSYPMDATDALRGEVFMSVAFMRNYDQLGGERVMKSMLDPDFASNGDDFSAKEFVPVLSGEPKNPQARAILNVTLSIWNRIFKEYGSYPLKPGWSSVLDEETRKLEASPTLANRYAAVLMPVFSQAEAALKRNAYRRGVTEALLTVLKYKQGTGRLPKTLEEAGVILTDDFGKPVVYKVSGQSFQIYSLGPNGIDDGGPTMTGSSSDKRDDGVVYPDYIRLKDPRTAAAGAL